MADMKDQEKSVLLVKAMGYGWEIHEDHNGCFMLDSEDVLLGEGDLYDPANMALAWRVLNWATEYERKNNEEMVLWWLDALLCNFPPADAQRLWLDKVLDLIAEATND